MKVKLGDIEVSVIPLAEVGHDDIYVSYKIYDRLVKLSETKELTCDHERDRFNSWDQCPHCKSKL